MFDQFQLPNFDVLPYIRPLRNVIRMIYFHLFVTFTSVAERLDLDLLLFMLLLIRFAGTGIRTSYIPHARRALKPTSCLSRLTFMKTVNNI